MVSLTWYKSWVEVAAAQLHNYLVALCSHHYPTIVEPLRGKYLVHRTEDQLSLFDHNWYSFWELFGRYLAHWFAAESVNLTFDYVVKKIHHGPFKLYRLDVGWFSRHFVIFSVKSFTSATHGQQVTPLWPSAVTMLSRGWLVLTAHGVGWTSYCLHCHRSVIKQNQLVRY